METVTNPPPLPPPPPIHFRTLAQNGWYLNSENLQALNSRLTTEGQAREVWKLLSLYPVQEVLRWVNSRQQNLNSGPSNNNLEDEKPVQQEEKMGQRPNELNEPKKPKENKGDWEQLHREGEMLGVQGAAVQQHSAGNAAFAGSRKQGPGGQGSAFPSRNGSQAGGTGRANCAGSEQQVHEAPTTTTNPTTRWQQNEFTIRVGCLIRDRIDPAYWHEITHLFTRPANRGPGQQVERFVVTTTFALSFSSLIISIRPPPPHLNINGQMVNGESSTHPPPPLSPPPPGASLDSRWVDHWQTTLLPPRDPRQRSQSAPIIQAMEEVIHRVVYTMAREFEEKAGIPPGAITNVCVKLGIGEE